jgi:GMP synthase PP-ATPase subunit
MNNEQYDMLKKNRSLVIAYMLVTEKYKNIHYIDLFDTVIRKNNLGFHMINKYKKNYDVNLIPQNIIETSARYWAKILNVVDDRNIVRKNLIEEFIETINIKHEDISWKYLYCLCDIDKDYDDELEYI